VIGWMELLLILFLALLILGGAWIPKLARRTGKAIHDFKSAMDEVQKNIDAGEEK